MAPFHVWPLMIPGLAVLLWSVEAAGSLGKPVRAACWRGFVFGIGYFLAGTFWVGFAFVSRGPEFIPLIPLALPAFAAMLAAFWGGATGIYMAMRALGVWRVLAFAASIALFEWLRGHMFSGLPWNLPAYTWIAGGTISQAASWFGVYGLSFLTVFILSSPAVSVGQGRAVVRFMPMMVGGAIFMLLLMSGAIRLASADTRYHPDIRMRIVQLALTQEEKWGDDGPEISRQRYLDATGTPDLDGVTHVLWPEGALPTFMLEDVQTLVMIEGRLGDAQLIAGVNRRALDEAGERRYYNALAAIDFRGITPRFSLYDKVRLVPFGEQLPLPGLLERIGFADFSRQMFSSGPGPRVMSVEGTPSFMPLICYEAIFPDFVRAMPERPQWLFNLSNDAWFGNTSGPRQHLNQARYRSIETGLPMVRSATRGISGVIDPVGRMPVRIERLDEGAHDVDLPLPVARPAYMWWGDGPFVFLIMLILAGFAVRRIRASRS